MFQWTWSLEIVQLVYTHQLQLWKFLMGIYGNSFYEFYPVFCEIKLKNCKKSKALCFTLMHVFTSLFFSEFRMSTCLERLRECFRDIS